jgi:hypothetical protein
VKHCFRLSNANNRQQATGNTYTHRLRRTQHQRWSAESQTGMQEEDWQFVEGGSFHGRLRPPVLDLLTSAFDTTYVPACVRLFGRQGRHPVTATY